MIDFNFFRHGGHVSQRTDLQWAVQINTKITKYTKLKNPIYKTWSGTLNKKSGVLKFKSDFASKNFDIAFAHVVRFYIVINYNSFVCYLQIHDKVQQTAVILLTPVEAGKSGVKALEHKISLQ